MKETIKNFPKQLVFEPAVENADSLFKTKNFIVCGMGGSHLSADLLKTWNPELNLVIHHDYGLPASAPGGLENYLIIISSYSGNTEEAIDGFKEALSKNFIPIIYASTRNEPVAYNWKIRFNETGKIPAFCNTFPELNHNEMVGFDGEKKTKELLKNFYFIFIKDKTDHPRTALRMEILKEMLQKKGFPVEILEMQGENIWEKMFFSLLIADWAAFHIAERYGLKPNEVAIVEKFKAILKKEK